MQTGKRILIIDDESDMAILLLQVLTDAAFDANVALDGQKGIEMATSGDFDMILLDMHMPGIDGMEVLRRLRDHEKTKHIPVIFVTGSTLDVDEIVAALELDPSDFVTKVISPKELIARIKWVFKKQQVS